MPSRNCGNPKPVHDESVTFDGDKQHQKNDQTTPIVAIPTFGANLAIYPFGRTMENCASPQNRGRTDATIAQLLEIGGKDLYRQARTIWRLAQSNDLRAQSAVTQLDAKTKTIHAAYKDLRRRDRFSADFRPTPYDVWSFRHDRAFGIPHPGAIPPAIVAHTLHYFTPPGGIVVDPMAGGGTTIDVCQSMGRRCLAYDIHPMRPDIQPHDIRVGFPPDASNCHLIFCDPPYHTMLAQKYAPDSIASIPLAQWISFLHRLARHAFETLRPGGYLALLLAPQTEKDLPAGFGYLDHAFYGYIAAVRAGFLPERRISCPMDGGYLPQQIQRARHRRSASRSGARPACRTQACAGNERTQTIRSC